MIAYLIESCQKNQTHQQKSGIPFRYTAFLIDYRHMPVHILGMCRIVRSFLGDLNIMRVALQQTGVGDLYELCLFVEQLKQRQREGIEIAKAQGKYTGRKPIPIYLDKFSKLYGEWKSKSITVRDFMRRMGLSVNTFHRRVREYESRNNLAEVRQP